MTITFYQYTGRDFVNMSILLLFYIALGDQPSACKSCQELWVLVVERDKKNDEKGSAIKLKSGQQLLLFCDTISWERMTQVL